MAEIKDIKDLLVYAWSGKNPDPTKYSSRDIRKALTEEIHGIANDYKSYRRNKELLFEIIQEAYDEILPAYVEAYMGTFAEIKNVPNGQKASYRVRKGRQRAKQFITQVGLSGAYEAVRLDSDTFELGGKAIGGATYLDFERTLTGDEDISEQFQLLLEGLEEAIYGEVQRAMMAAANAEDRPTKNVYTSATFDADAMQELCAIADAYGGGSAIFATPEFIASMGPDAIGHPVYAPYALTANPTAGSAPGYATPVYSPRDIEDIARTGYITTFRGHPVIKMPQSYTDETNETTTINPGFAYIMPTGGEKVVKLVFEGETQVDDFKNRDRSYEIEVYKKVGVAILTHYNWCIYENTSLSTGNTKYPVVH